MSHYRWPLPLCSLLVVLGVVGSPLVPAAAPPDDRILSVGQYTSEKARSLATKYASALRDLNHTIYHCLPWLEVQKDSIGFFKPKGSAHDDRYLSVRVYVEQDPSPQFASLRIEQRAAAMFSRYVGPLLRRMAREGDLVREPSLDGFTVIVEWLKQEPRAVSERPIHETIAVFVRKSVVAEYLAGRTSIGNVADLSRVLAFDGEQGLGQIRLTAWEDNFVASHRPGNYQLADGVRCR